MSAVGTLTQAVRRSRHDRGRHPCRRGASMTEYGLIITFIAVLMMLVVAAVGQSVARTFDHASTVFANATGAPPTAP